jgi:putative addiction module killer protein
MFEVLKSREFDNWLDRLADKQGKAKITARVQRLEQGNPGQVRPVGAGISEMKIDFGPGYRVYFKQTDRTIILILCGGDKSTQTKDIMRAKQIAETL